MPVVSVKLPDETKRRLQTLAQAKGVTPHAVMVGAIEDALAAEEHKTALVTAALRSRDQVLATGQVLDGREFTQYLMGRAKNLAAASPTRPPSQTLQSIVANPR